MLEKLPIGWVKTTLGEIRRDASEGISQKDMEGETFELYSVPAFSSGKPEIVTGEQVGSNKILVAPGDTLLCKINPRINRAWVVNTSKGMRQIASTEWIVFSRQEGIVPEFLRHFFTQDAFRNYLAGNVSGVGGSLMRVRPAVVEKFPLNLPPTREQQRIVAKLDASLSRISLGEAAARRALDRVQRYRAAVLDAAVTGELTRDWRKKHPPEETGTQLLRRLLVDRRSRWEEVELKRVYGASKPPADYKWKKRYPEPDQPEVKELPSIPKTWAWASAGQLTEATRPITYGVIKLGPEISGGIPILRSSNVRRLQLDLTGLKRISRKIANNYERTYLQGLEILVTVRGTLGGVVVVPSECAGYNISREVAMLVPLEKGSSQSLAFFIASNLLQNWLNKRTRGVAYTGINIETLRQLPLPVPPLNEQIQIASEVERRLRAAEALASTLELQLERARVIRQSTLREAFMGKLVPQDPNDEPAADLLERIRLVRDEQSQAPTSARNTGTTPKSPKETADMSKKVPTIEDLQNAWQQIGKKPDAKKLLLATGFAFDQVTTFYELLAASPEIMEGFRTLPTSIRTTVDAMSVYPKFTKGRFRLLTLWLEDFKNLKDYGVYFDAAHGLDIVLGWNGTGKSNLFEALIIIFRDLHYWCEKNKWPDEPMAGYSLSYEIDNHIVEVKWTPSQMKRPIVMKAPMPRDKGGELDFKLVKRNSVPLPKFVFGYYSGPTNRLADHFWPMKRDHYERLRKANSDDPNTLAKLLEQRRFFCAETSHAKYVLLAFSYKEDSKIWKFLEDRLRIVAFESALFVIRKPRWAKGKPEDFWGATGIMRRVMEKLRRYAIAPMVLKQKVADGYRLPSEELYYFFLPDLKSLHAFAAEYADARSFFLALESTDFSELIYDVKIQVRVKAAHNQAIRVTFRELSEGEQQLLMVLGLMRFTKSHESLILLDEPDTHLNPHWSVDYLKDLIEVISGNDEPSPEQQTSQLLMATHDPLVIASLLKEQVHLLKRDRDSFQCYWALASEDPRGLGFSGILISDMFGFRSDLDEETLELLDRQVQLAGKSNQLSEAEKEELGKLNKQIDALGFKRVSSDPYYRTFIEALNRRHKALELIQQPVQTAEERRLIREAADEILTKLASEIL